MLPILLVLLVAANGPGARTASATRYGWNNPAGGSAGTASNWTDLLNATHHAVPGATDQARLEGASGYTVTWPAANDTLQQFLAGGTARPRVSAAGTLGIADVAAVQGDSFTVVRGILRAARWTFDQGALLVSEPGTELVARDSTVTTTFGSLASLAAKFQKGARLTSFGSIAFGTGAASVATRFIGSSAPGAPQAGFVTRSANGLPGRGNVGVGESGPAAVTLESGASGAVAGHLLLGALAGGDATFELANVVGQDSMPSLTVGGGAFLGCDTTRTRGGMGWLRVRRGRATVAGPLVIRHGGIEVSNGATLATGALDMGIPEGSSDSVFVRGAGSRLDLHGGATIGVESLANAYSLLLVADGGRLVCDGSSPFTIALRGRLTVDPAGTFVSSAPIEVHGTTEVRGRLEAPLVHVAPVTPSNGAMIFAGDESSIAGRIRIESGGELQTIGDDFVPGSCWLGDSTLTDAIVCDGRISLGSAVPTDSVVMLSAGPIVVKELLSDRATLRVLHGFVIPAGGQMVTRGTFSGDFRIEGTLNTFGDVTFVDGTLTLASATVMSLVSPPLLSADDVVAYGAVGGTLRVAGTMSLGPTPGTLVVEKGLELLASSTLRMRVGPPANGQSDLIVIAPFEPSTGHLAALGTLDIRTIAGNLPAATDTITIITQPQITTPVPFTSVLLDGSPAGARVQLLYEPKRVRVVVKPSAADVATGDTPAFPSVFRASAPHAARAFELSLPEAAMVEADVFDVAGRHVATLHGGSLGAGRHVFDLPSSLPANGVCFARAIVRDARGVHELHARGTWLR